MATWREMIPVIPVDETPALVRSLRNLMQASLYGLVIGAPLPNAGAMPALPIPVHANDCLTSGDGYFRAHLADAIETVLDWPNKGTRCEGEARDKPPGVRMSFQRSAGGKHNLLFVFGITGVREAQPARTTGVNLTVIVQGTSHIYGTLGDSRCTVDSLSQRPLAAPRSYRVEARGFCTQPAHALRGKDALLVSTFEFAGLVVYDSARDEPPLPAAKKISR